MIDWHLIVSMWGNRSSQQEPVETAKKKKKKAVGSGREDLENLSWAQPNAQLCCSSDKYMFITNVTKFKREINRLSSGIRFTDKNHCYNK